MTVTEPIVFDRIADRYDETRGGEPRGAVIAADVAPWLMAGTVLEVAVGTGVVATALTAAGHPTLGIDLSPEMIARARVRLGPRVAIGDARTLPVGDSTVDNVLFVWALHLVGDIGAALREAARVVRPGGRVVVVYGNASEVRRDIDEAMGTLRECAQAPDTPEAVQAAAAAAGLRPVYDGYTTPRPFRTSPTREADLIEQKSWSRLWQLSEAEFAELTAPVIAALRALPDPDHARILSSRNHLVVLSGGEHL